ncbi:MAG: hypothetical protein WKF47_13745 [Geodermatophilaceae bacterium]|jgi:hypothetical protein
MIDPAILAQLLRADLLPEAWIAPPATCQLRAAHATGSSWRGLRILQRNRRPRRPRTGRPGA